MADKRRACVSLSSLSNAVDRLKGFLKRTSNSVAIEVLIWKEKKVFLLENKVREMSCPVGNYNG